MSIDISDITPLNQYIATNLQTVFNVTWTADAIGDVRVYARATGTTSSDIDDLVDASNYTVTLVGGTLAVRVTFAVGRTTGDIVTITRDTPVTRDNLYINTNFTPTMLNGDFARTTMTEQENEMYHSSIGPRYNVSATLEPTLVANAGNVDRILPILGVDQGWVKNTAGTAITAVDIPSQGVAPKDATFITQTANSQLDNEQALGALGTGLMSSTTTTGVVSTSTLTGTSSEVDVVNGTGVGGNPTVSLSSTIDAPGTFTVASSTVINAIINDSTMATSGADNVSTSAAMKSYVDSSVTASKVDSVVGTSNEIVIDNSDPVNPIVGFADNAAMPGVAGLQLPTGTTAQRATPISPAINLRYNTDNTAVEYYDHGVPGWVSFSVANIGSTLNSVQWNNAGAFDGTSNFTTDGSTVTITGALAVDNITVNGNTIVSSDTNGDLNLVPNGSGDLVLDVLKWPQADGSIGQVMQTDGSGQLSFVDTVSPVNLQDETYVYAVDTGSANAVLAAFTPAVLAYKDGQKFSIKVAARNTGATTINVDGLGLKNIRNTDDSALLEGELLANQIYSFVYNSSSGNFEVEDPERVAVAAQSFYNGSTLTDFTADVTSDGATITLTFESSGGGDVTTLFSSGTTVIDCTPALTISLTAGTATTPVTNYTYILQSAPTVLANSTSAWPTAEHLPVAKTICQTAALLQTQGAYSHHLWTEHVSNSNNEGHMVDVNYWIRQQPATWISGVAATTPSIGAGVFDIATSVGEVLQLHPHAMPAFDTSGANFVLVANDTAGAYTQYANLTTLITDAAGGSLSGKYYNLCLWGVVSENTADCQLMINVPSGSYNNSTSAVDDVDSTTIYTIPGAFRGTAFLIARLTIRNQSGSGGTFTLENNEDLRGLLPATASGSGIGGISALIDDPNPTLANDLNMSTFGLKDANDNELMLFGTTTSAVNEVTVTNAATGAGPLISSTGGDTNVDLSFAAKGTGVTRIQGAETVIASSAVSGEGVLNFFSETTASVRYASIRSNWASPYGLTFRASNSAVDSVLIFEGSTATEYARFNASGQLGIGTTGPSSALDVIGGIETSTGVSTGISGTSSATDTQHTASADANSYSVTKYMGASTATNILQITIPASTIFLSVECSIANSRAPFSAVGTSFVQKKHFTISRNGSGSDVVLDALTGIDTSAITTTAGGAQNVISGVTTIARNGAEANTAPQVVNITLNPSTTSTSSGGAVIKSEILYLGTVTGFSFT